MCFSYLKLSFTSYRTFFIEAQLVDIVHYDVIELN